MDRNDVDWKGYWVAAPTPFTATGALDEAGWREILRLYLRQGVHGVLVNGTTGEWFSQTDAERRRVAEITVEELRGKMPVVIGCTTFTPRPPSRSGNMPANRRRRLLSTPPPYAAPTPREIAAFFRASPMRLICRSWCITGHAASPWRSPETCGGAGEDRPRRCDQGQHDQCRAGVRHLRRCRGMPVCSAVSSIGSGSLSSRGSGGDGNIDGGGLGAEFAVDCYESFWRGDLPPHVRRPSGMSG